MPKKKELDNVACYWQSDASPTPEITIEKFTTQKKAEAWLKKQLADQHVTARIGVLTVEAEVEDKTMGLTLEIVTPIDAPENKVEAVEDDCECFK